MLLKDLLERIKEQNLQIPDFSIKKNYIDKLNDIRQCISQYNQNEACWFKFQYIFKVCDHVRIYKYKINFAKDYTQNFFEESLVIRKALSRGHILLVILIVKKLLERFIKKDWKMQIKKSLELKR